METDFLFCIEIYSQVPRANSMDYSVPVYLLYSRLKRKGTRVEPLGSIELVGENTVKPGDVKPVDVPVKSLVDDPLAKPAENSVEELRSLLEDQTVCCGVIR